MSSTDLQEPLAALREQMEKCGYYTQAWPDAGLLLFIAEEIPRLVGTIFDQARQIREMKADLDQIALYLRHHYQREIESGLHAGRRLGDIITLYLAREREAAKAADAGSSRKQ
jgi:hypothetical protein